MAGVAEAEEAVAGTGDTEGNGVSEGDKGAEYDGKGGVDLEDTGLSGETKLHSSAISPTLTTLPDGLVDGSTGKVVVHFGPINPLLVSLNDEQGR